MVTRSWGGSIEAIQPTGTLSDGREALLRMGLVLANLSRLRKGRALRGSTGTYAYTLIFRAGAAPPHTRKVHFGPHAQNRHRNIAVNADTIRIHVHSKPYAQLQKGHQNGAVRNNSFEAARPKHVQAPTQRGWCNVFRAACTKGAPK